MTETNEARLKRLRLRSWRRGIKEMDLILGNWADANLDALSEEDLQLYDQLLTENDHDLYMWVSGQSQPPAQFSALLAQIAKTLEKPQVS